MTLRKILVPIRGDGRGEAVLSYAAALARRHSAHLQAVHCRARPADFIPIGVNVPRAFRAQIEAQGETLAREEGAALREKFLALLPGLGIEPTEEATAPTDRATGSWTEAAGKMADVIRIYGRLADLVAVAKPDRDANLGVNSLRAAIYQTARPVLMCPPEAAPADFGRRVAIAWNGSLEATRAVALNLPVLRMAEEVVVLDGGAEHSATGGAALLVYLAEHGVTARAVSLNARDHPGEVILSEAENQGASLILMGAYSHSHEHEVIFGGATQQVVDQTAKGIILVH